MLHKRHNSIITLAILLTLVGVSKPAKAFLLAQSDTAPPTFTVPDQLPEGATVKIAASNSTDSISTSLKDSFAAKYPQAEVENETQGSDTALKNLAEGQVDLAAIGRNLTAEEKAQGFVSVPVSREKIAIVVSKENPYDGNLTIGQFAQIFRGEITDWSEIGGAPGAIKLVDLPNSNDTRTAFPNYPVFQSAEFTTGSTASQLQQDSTDAMIAELGENGIGYAVANDVVNRDDVKIVTMHQTQPGDPRYPFSQPFSLVYQGEPTEAAQAYIGFATNEGGQEVVKNRIGSLSTAAVTGIAAGVGADGIANNNGTDPTTESPAEAELGSEQDPDAIADGADGDNPDETDTAAGEQDPDAIADGAGADNPDETDTAAGEQDPDAIADGADADNPDETDTAAGEQDPDAIADGADADNPDETDTAAGEQDPDAIADGTDGEDSNPSLDEAEDDVLANADVDPDDVSPDVDNSGEINPDVDGSGEANPGVADSGEINQDIDGSGEVSPDIDGSGEINPEIEGSGELNPEIEGSGDPLSAGVEGTDAEEVAPVVPNESAETQGTEVAAKRGGKWWLWLLPLLAIPVLGVFFLGGRKKSDQEPALSNVPPNINSPEGGMNVPGMSGGRNVPPVGANVSGNLGNVTENSGGASSKLGAAGLAAGGAALAGGAAAAANVAGRRNRIENGADVDADLDIELDESSSVAEIPSNPVSEFTGQETKLQSGDQATELQTEDDLDVDPISPEDAAIAGGTAVVGGVTAAEFSQDTESNTETNADVAEFTSDQPTDLTQPNPENIEETDSFDTDVADDEEFRGDFVLHEETRTTDFGTAYDTPQADLNTEKNLDVENISADLSTDIDIDNPDVDLDATGDEISASVATPDLDLELPSGENPTADGGTGILDGVNKAGGAAIAGGAAALGGAAAAASGLFNRGQDEAENTNIDLPDAPQDTDLNLDLGDRVNEVNADINTNLTDTVGEVKTPDFDLATGVDADINAPNVPQDADLNLNLGDRVNDLDLDIDAGNVTTPEVDLPNVNQPNVANPTAEGGTGILDGVNKAGGAAIAGGAAALGGAAAAASGLFNRGQDGAEDTNIDLPDAPQDTDLNLDLGDRANEVDANIDTDSVSNPDLDLSIEGDSPANVIDLRQEGDLNLDDSDNNLDLDLDADTSIDSIGTPDLDLSAQEDTAANVLDLREDENFDLSDLSIDIDDDTADGSGTGIIDNVNKAGGAAALGGAAAATSGLFNRDSKSTADIQEFETFETSFEPSVEKTSSSFADNVIADAETTSIDEDNDLSEITLDNITDTADLNLEEMTLGDADTDVNISLEEITFDDADNNNTINASLEEITFDDDKTTASDVEISLDDLGFEESKQANAPDLLSNKTAEITSLSDDQSNDLNNISEWLDSLETPSKDTDNISDWLDTLDKESISINANDTQTNLNQEEATNITEQADDISFQFLEDLLDRDADNNSDRQ